MGLGNLTSDKSKAPDEDNLFSEEAMEQMPVNDKTDLPETELPIESSSDLPAPDTSTDLPTENAAGDLPKEMPVIKEKAEETDEKPEPTEGTKN